MDVESVLKRATVLLLALPSLWQHLARSEGNGMSQLRLLIVSLVGIGAGLFITGCAAGSGIDSDSRSASIRVVVAPGGDDSLTRCTILR
jgi:hypothetical protein